VSRRVSSRVRRAHQPVEAGGRGIIGEKTGARQELPSHGGDGRRPEWTAPPPRAVLWTTAPDRRPPCAARPAGRRAPQPHPASAPQSRRAAHPIAKRYGRPRPWRTAGQVMNRGR